MTDAVLIQAITGGVTVVVAIISSVNVWQNSRIHKAVNSTASLLAEKATAKEAELSAKEAENSTLSAENARLRQLAEGKQTAQDLKDARTDA